MSMKNMDTEAAELYIASINGAAEYSVFLKNRKIAEFIQSIRLGKPINCAQDVITSYSIHYTKLYEELVFHPHRGLNHQN